MNATHMNRLAKYHVSPLSKIYNRARRPLFPTPSAPLSHHENDNGNSNGNSNESMSSVAQGDASVPPFSFSTTSSPSTRGGTFNQQVKDQIKKPTTHTRPSTPSPGLLVEHVTVLKGIDRRLQVISERDGILQSQLSKQQSQIDHLNHVVEEIANSEPSPHFSLNASRAAPTTSVPVSVIPMSDRLSQSISNVQNDDYIIKKEKDSWMVALVVVGIILIFLFVALIVVLGCRWNAQKTSEVRNQQRDDIQKAVWDVLASQSQFSTNTNTNSHNNSYRSEWSSPTPRSLFHYTANQFQNQNQHQNVSYNDGRSMTRSSPLRIGP